MSSYRIEDKGLEIEVLSKGAELRSLKYNGIEFMWEADPKYWGKTSPVLFPFIGGIKDEKYTFKGKEYVGTKHGFARDMEFQMVEQKDNKLVFKLSATKETLLNYPFDFDFYIEYLIVLGGLTINYRVVNKGLDKMYFSLGAHPAFATPTNKDIKFEDYYLEFDKDEVSKTYNLEGMFIAKERSDYLEGKNIDLKTNMFGDDTLMFEGLNSKAVTLKNTKDSRSVRMEYEGFPILAFWNVDGADYICIEPWCGIADFAESSGRLEEKYGIEVIEAKSEFLRSLKIQVSV